MTTQKLFCCFLIIATVYKTVSAENVECIKCINEHSKISTQNTNHIKIGEDIKNVGPKTHILPISPFISQLSHNGDNLFFQPQIVMGSTITGPFGYEQPYQDNGDYEYNFSPSHEIVESGQVESLTPVKHETIIETPLVPDPLTLSTAGEIITPIVIPEPPAYIPINPPKVSSLHIHDIIADHQLLPVTNPLPCPEPSKQDLEIREIVSIPEPPAYIPLNAPKVSLHHVQKVELTDHHDLKVTNLLPSPELTKPNVEIRESVLIPEPPAFIPLNAPKVSLHHVQKVELTDHHDLKVTNLLPSPEPTKPNVEIRESVLIPEPPAFIPLNPPKVPSLHIHNIKLTDHQLLPVTNSLPCPEPSKPDVEIQEIITIPEPPAYIPLDAPKHSLHHVQKVELTDHHDLKVTNLLPSPEPTKPNVEIRESVLIPEPPAFIPLNPPKVPSLNIHNIKLTDHQLLPITNSLPCPEPSKPDVEIQEIISIPEPPAFIPLDAPKHSLHHVQKVELTDHHDLKVTNLLPSPEPTKPNVEIRESVLIPEPPAFIPLIPPKVPSLHIHNIKLTDHQLLPVTNSLPCPEPSKPDVEIQEIISIPEPPAFIPLDAPKHSLHYIQKVELTDHHDLKVTNLLPSPEPTKPNVEIRESVLIPEPPAFIPLNPPKIPSLHIHNIKLTDDQLLPVTKPLPNPEPSKPNVEIREIVSIPAPSAFIPLNPLKLSLHHLQNIKLTDHHHHLSPVIHSPPCPEKTDIEIHKPIFISEPASLNSPKHLLKVTPEISKCPPTISEKYKIFVCPSLVLPQYKETLEINDFKTQPHTYPVPIFTPTSYLTG